MTNPAFRLMLFVKDFTGKGGDSFYWFHDDHFEETDAASIVGFAGILL